MTAIVVNIKKMTKIFFFGTVDIFLKILVLASLAPEKMIL